MRAITDIRGNEHKACVDVARLNLPGRPRACYRIEDTDGRGRSFRVSVELDGDEKFLAALLDRTWASAIGWCLSAEADDMTPTEAWA